MAWVRGRHTYLAEVEDVEEVKAEAEVVQGELELRRDTGT